MSGATDGNGDAAARSAYECGKDSLARLVSRTRHAISGVRLSVERCPDATSSRAVRSAAVGGGLGVVAGFLIRRSPVFLIGSALASAALGGLLSQYHISLDWDPDRAFGGEKPAPQPEVH